MWDVLPIAAAVAGGAVGASSSYYLQRGRPSVVVDSLKIRPQFGDSQKNVTLDEDLIELCHSYPVRLDVTDDDLRALPTEGAYLSALRDSREVLSREQARIRITKGNFLDARQATVDEDYDRLLRELAKSSDIFGVIGGEAIRVGVNLPAIEQRGSEPLSDDEPLYLTDNKKLLVVPVSGPYNLVLGWSGFPPVHDVQLRRMAIGLCRVFLTRDKKVILPVIDACIQMLDRALTAGQAITLRIDASLAPYGRLIVDGIVINRGRAAFSVLPRCKCFVMLKDYPSAAGLVASDVEIALRLFEDEAPSGEGDPRVLRAPLLVPPGESHRFLAVAEHTIGEIGYSEALLQAFAGGTVNSYLALASVGVARGEAKPLYSRDRLFRDLEASEQLPPRR